ncbi:protein maelstrom homolog [Dryobates pubescens]|uniref:protein maelstrom homolog n=1 Tax=Dryobates pubescens TaxID=118200 RepID=UPI0023B902BA|nr:protein maelstrom homolog [Dryobates pubescens]
MSSRRASRSAFYCFAREQLPGLRGRGVPVSRVVDAIPYCSQAWALLPKEERILYMEMAHKENRKNGSQKTVTESNLMTSVRLYQLFMSLIPSQRQLSCAKHLHKVHGEYFEIKFDKYLPCDKWFEHNKIMSVTADIFYFLNIYSHGKLPSHCEQRFLPCEIGCVKFSLQDGIIADFHHFIDPEVPPCGFRYHCQAASDATHKIPVSGFHLPCASYAVVLQELLDFVQPARDAQPQFYCRHDDRFRVSWCLNRMASQTGIVKHLELLAVEDLVTELYRKKYKEEPSKTWVCRELDVFLWDFCSNTRCKWHEENDIVCCALASCKKIAYCISRSLAGVYGVSLTAAHLPSDYDESMNTKMVILDAGRFQKMKAERSECDRHLAPLSHNQELMVPEGGSPCGVKNDLYGASGVRGRGITRLNK